MVLEQEFLTVVSCHLGAGHLNLSPGRAASTPTAEPYLKFHSTTFLKSLLICRQKSVFFCSLFEQKVNDGTRLYLNLKI